MPVSSEQKVVSTCRPAQPRVSLARTAAPLASTRGNCARCREAIVTAAGGVAAYRVHFRPDVAGATMHSVSTTHAALPISGSGFVLRISGSDMTLQGNESAPAELIDNFASRCLNQHHLHPIPLTSRQLQRITRTPLTQTNGCHADKTANTKYHKPPHRQTGPAALTGNSMISIGEKPLRSSQVASRSKTARCVYSCSAFGGRGCASASSRTSNASSAAYSCA
eukprot:1095354-Rhodomonas_salina.1